MAVGIDMSRDVVLVVSSCTVEGDSLGDDFVNKSKFNMFP